MNLTWKRFGDHTLPLPRQAKPGDAGYDLIVPEDIKLYPGERKHIATGWAVAIPSGWVGLISERSGLARKYGLAILGGVIDSGYRGEIGIIMLITGAIPVTIPSGTAIAQMIVIPCLHATSIEAEELDETERGANGFGHTDGIGHTDTA